MKEQIKQLISSGVKTERGIRQQLGDATVPVLNQMVANGDLSVELSRVHGNTYSFRDNTPEEVFKAVEMSEALYEAPEKQESAAGTDDETTVEDVVVEAPEPPVFKKRKK